MKKTLTIALLACSSLLALPVANAGIIELEADLLGTNEVPAESGDLDGTGYARLVIDDAALTVTWLITTANIGAPVAAHIHEGAAGVNGPVRVDFSGQLSGGPITNAFLAGVLASPAGWYVNVHTAQFPRGAVRGQLRKVPEPATLALMGLGLLGVAAARRRRARTT